MWLCVECMKVQSWKRPCLPHNGDILVGPFNGRNADFLIHGIEKPETVVDSSMTDMDETSDASMGLSLDILDLIYKNQITTIVSIPPPCRLNFSRTLKTVLE